MDVEFVRGGGNEKMVGKEIECFVFFCGIVCVFNFCFFFFGGVLW